MNKVIAILTLLLLLPTALTAGATQTSDKLTIVAKLQSRNNLRQDLDLSTLTASPMLRQIKAVVDSARLVEAELRAEFNKAQDDGGALGEKARIASLQRETQQKILQIQLRYARLEGRTDLVEQIEATLAAMLDPAERRRAPVLVRPE